MGEEAIRSVLKKACVGEWTEHGSRSAIRGIAGRLIYLQLEYLYWNALYKYYEICDMLNYSPNASVQKEKARREMNHG